MADIQGFLDVNGLPRNGATVKLWSAGAFGAAPQLNTPLPSGSPIASTVTGPQHGADGAYRFLNVTVGQYYVSLEWLGIIVYQYHNRPNSPWSDLKTGYGAGGDGIVDDGPAIASYLNALVANTAASGQVELVIPPGTYRVTNTITVPNMASNFSISGPGYRSAIIIWDGPSGVPVFQLNSSRGVLMRDFGILGNSTASKKPSAILEINRNTNPTGGLPSPQECRFERLYLGGYASDMCGVCVLVDGSSDNDNDKHTFWECSLQGATKYGYHFKDTNALWENVIGGQILDCKIAGISNCSDNTSSGTQGGGFMCIGTRFLHVGTLFEIGESYHQIQIVNPQAESCSGFINTPHTIQGAGAFSTPTHVLVMGGSVKLADGTDLKFDATNKGRLDIHGLLISSPNGFTASFPTSGAVVSIFGGDWTCATFSYNCNLNIHGLHESGGSVTFTNLGNGRLRFVNAGKGSNTTDDLLTAFGVDATQPLCQVRGDGTASLQPQTKGAEVLVAGMIRDATGNVASGWATGETSFRVKVWGAGQKNGWLSYRPFDRLWYFTGSAGAVYDDATIDVKVNGKMYAVSGLGVGNSASGTTLGSVVKKIQIFDATGGSLGYIPVYDAIT